MVNKQDILKYIEDNEAVLTAILSKLITFNTENNGKSGNETPLSEYLKREYESLGYTADVYCPEDFSKVTSHIQYLTSRNITGRKNITAKICGESPSKSLMLAGHLDTVPVGQLSDWSYPPFEGTIVGDNLYGRGATDDKYALASCLFIAGMFKDLNISLKNNLYFTGYIDEEFGGGNGALCACINYPCNFYLNLDGHGGIWDLATGGQRIAIHLKHNDNVSSCEDIMDALYICKEKILSFGRKRKEELRANPHYTSDEIPDDAIRIMAVSTGTNTSDKNRGIIDFAFYTDRPHSVIQSELDEMLKDIANNISSLNIYIENVEYKSRFFDFGISRAEKEISLLKKSSRKMCNNDLPEIQSSLSDLNIFISCSDGNAAAYGIGREFSEKGGAHQVDEYISIESLKQFTAILSQFIIEWDNNDD